MNRIIVTIRGVEFTIEAVNNQLVISADGYEADVIIAVDGDKNIVIVTPKESEDVKIVR